MDEDELIANDESMKPILLVEDEESIATPLRKLLQFRGLNLAWASDGEAALEWLAHNPAPRCFLVDIMMPRMDGWTLHERLRADAKFAEVPIVFLSADNRSAREAQRRGEVFVPKPIDLDLLVKTIETEIGPERMHA